MNAAVLAAAALSDRDLLARLAELASRERAALVELLAHIAELDTRQSLYAAEGYGSLFAYCTKALGLSEDAAYSRIEAARACRRFPAILDRLADGSVTLTAVRMVARHLTPDNHVEVLAAARRRTKAEIEALVARLAPKPDAPPVIRRLSQSPPVSASAPTATPASSERETAPPPPARPPVIKASAPERFLVQLTVGQETHDRFRRLQALYARECAGDPVAVFDLACRVLEEQALRTKRAAVAKPRPAVSGEEAARTRHVPAAVSRAVWARDGNRCAFVGRSGVRCGETMYLELHHVIPWVIGGPTSVANLSVRCRTHNVYEAEQAFGARAMRSFRRGAGKAAVATAARLAETRGPGMSAG